MVVWNEELEQDLGYRRGSLLVPLRTLCLTIASSGTLLHRPEFELRSWLPKGQHVVTTCGHGGTWLLDLGMGGKCPLSSVAQWSTYRCPPWPTSDLEVGRIFLVTLSGHLLDCERHSPSLQLPIVLLVPCLFQIAAIHTERKPPQGDTHRLTPLFTHRSRRGPTYLSQAESAVVAPQALDSQGPSGMPGGGAGSAQGLAHSTPARLQQPP